MSVQVTLTGLPLKCQYRLPSQACRPSVSTDYTRRRTAEHVNRCYTHRPTSPTWPISTTSALELQLIVSCFWLAKVLTCERVQHSCRVPVGLRAVSFYHTYRFIFIYRVSQKECARLRESVPYVKVYRYNTKHLYPKLNGYGDNGQRSLKLWQLLHTYWLPNTY